MRFNETESLLKTFLYAGLLLVVVGIASLLVPIPHRETQGIEIRDTNIGVQTRHDERVPPIVSVVLIASGIVLTIACMRTPLPKKWPLGQRQLRLPTNSPSTGIAFTAARRSSRHRSKSTRRLHSC